MAGFAQQLGLVITDDRWYMEALSHSSWVGEQPDPSLMSYERLEWLGDAVIHRIVSDELFERLPTCREGILSRVRAAVESDTALAQRADALGIAAFARLGRGEDMAGRRHRLGLLADLLEALVGAIYRDNGEEAARQWVLRNLADDIDAAIAAENIPSTGCRAMLSHTSPVTFRIAGAEGPDHVKVWTCAVERDGTRLVVGWGSTKKQAVQDAARRVLLLGV